MHDKLIALLRTVPFVPFVVTLKTHEVYQIESVEQLSVGKELFCVVDADGQLRVHSFQSIYDVAVLDLRA
jgi:hypothetical protein